MIVNLLHCQILKASAMSAATEALSFTGESIVNLFYRVGLFIGVHLNIRFSFLSEIIYLSVLTLLYPTLYC